MSDKMWILTRAITIAAALLVNCASCVQRAIPQQTAEPVRSPEIKQIAINSNETGDHTGLPKQAHSNKLSCSISVDETDWSQGRPAFVSVVVQNISGDRLELKVTPAFFFRLESAAAKTDEFTTRRNEYWGPVDIKESRALGAPKSAFLSLQKNESLRSRIDLNNLKWELAIGPQWPSNELFALVPKGRYQFYLDIQESEPYGYESVGSSKVPLVKHALSNPVLVVIN